MASPVGHSLIGCAVYLWWSGRRTRSHLAPPLRPAWMPALFIVLANLPDVDFFISWILTGNPNIQHFGWTHTLVFALIVSVSAGWILKLEPGPWASSLVVLAAVGSHTIIDFFTGPAWGWARTYGIPWLAPLTMEKLFSPLTLFVGPRHKNLDQLLSLHNVLWAVYELALLSPVLLLIHRLNHRPASVREPK